MSMEDAKRTAAELGLDETTLSPMESARRMTPNYYVEKRMERERAEREAAAAPSRSEETSRPLELITEEIVFYKRQAGASIIEIGRRLNEAKAQLSHGEWLPWLREKVDLSERSAQNFMRLAREYPNSAVVADLGAAKALALLALPESERAGFAAETHVVNGREKTVADMTGDELKRAVAERDEALRQAEAARTQARTAQENAEKLVGEERARLDALRVKSEGMAEKLKKAKEKEQAARAELENARTEKAELEKRLEELKSRPVEVAVETPGQEELDRLRAEAETAAGEKVKEAERKLAEARAAAAASERAAEELRRQLAAADESTQAFKFRFEAWQREYNDMLSALRTVAEADAVKAEKLKAAIRAAAERMGAGG